MKKLGDGEDDKFFDTLGVDLHVNEEELDDDLSDIDVHDDDFHFQYSLYDDGQWKLELDEFSSRAPSHAGSGNSTDSRSSSNERRDKRRRKRSKDSKHNNHKSSRHRHKDTNKRRSKNSDYHDDASSYASRNKKFAKESKGMRWLERQMSNRVGINVDEEEKERPNKQSTFEDVRTAMMKPHRSGDTQPNTQNVKKKNSRKKNNLKIKQDANTTTTDRESDWGDEQSEEGSYSDIDWDMKDDEKDSKKKQSNKKHKSESKKRSNSKRNDNNKKRKEKDKTGEKKLKSPKGLTSIKTDTNRNDKDKDKNKYKNSGKKKKSKKERKKLDDNNDNDGKDESDESLSFEGFDDSASKEMNVLVSLSPFSNEDNKDGNSPKKTSTFRPESPQNIKYISDHSREGSPEAGTRMARYRSDKGGKTSFEASTNLDTIVSKKSSDRMRALPKASNIDTIAEERGRKRREERNKNNDNKKKKRQNGSDNNKSESESKSKSTSKKRKHNHKHRDKDKDRDKHKHKHSHKRHKKGKENTRSKRGVTRQVVKRRVQKRVTHNVTMVVEQDIEEQVSGKPKHRRRKRKKSKKKDRKSDLIDDERERARRRVERKLKHLREDDRNTMDYLNDRILELQQRFERQQAEWSMKNDEKKRDNESKEEMLMRLGWKDNINNKIDNNLYIMNGLQLHYASNLLLHSKNKREYEREVGNVDNNFGFERCGTHEFTHLMKNLLNMDQNPNIDPNHVHNVSQFDLDNLETLNNVLNFDNETEMIEDILLNDDYLSDSFDSVQEGSDIEREFENELEENHLTKYVNIVNAKKMIDDTFMLGVNTKQLNTMAKLLENNKKQQEQEKKNQELMIKPPTKNNKKKKRKQDIDSDDEEDDIYSTTTKKKRKKEIDYGYENRMLLQDHNVQQNVYGLLSNFKKSLMLSQMGLTSNYQQVEKNQKFKNYNFKKKIHRKLVPKSNKSRKSAKYIRIGSGSGSGSGSDGGTPKPSSRINGNNTNFESFPRKYRITHYPGAIVRLTPAIPYYKVHKPIVLDNNSFGLNKYFDKNIGDANTDETNSRATGGDSYLSPQETKWKNAMANGKSSKQGKKNKKKEQEEAHTIKAHFKINMFDTTASSSSSDDNENDGKDDEKREYEKQKPTPGGPNGNASSSSMSDDTDGDVLITLPVTTTMTERSETNYNDASNYSNFVTDMKQLDAELGALQISRLASNDDEDDDDENGNNNLYESKEDMENKNLFLSNIIALLPIGTVVTVEEIIVTNANTGAGRARISEPIQGWISTHCNVSENIDIGNVGNTNNNTNTMNSNGRYNNREKSTNSSVYSEASDAIMMNKLNQKKIIEIESVNMISDSSDLQISTKHSELREMRKALFEYIIGGYDFRNDINNNNIDYLQYASWNLRDAIEKYYLDKYDAQEKGETYGMTWYSETKLKEKSKKNKKNKRLSTNTGGEGEIMDGTTTGGGGQHRRSRSASQSKSKSRSRNKHGKPVKIDRADINSIKDVDMYIFQSDVESDSDTASSKKKKKKNKKKKNKNNKSGKTFEKLRSLSIFSSTKDEIDDESKSSKSKSKSKSKTKKKKRSPSEGNINSNYSINVNDSDGNIVDGKHKGGAKNQHMSKKMKKRVSFNDEVDTDRESDRKEKEKNNNKKRDKREVAVEMQITGNAPNRNAQKWLDDRRESFSYHD